MYIFTIAISIIIISLINKRWTKNNSIINDEKRIEIINTDLKIMEENTVSLKTTICNLLNKKDYRYLISCSGHRYELSFNNEESNIETKKLFIEVSQQEKYVKYTSIICANVPSESLLRVFELICRLNEHYIIGHYNFLIEEGLIVFQVFDILNERSSITETDFELFMSHTYDAIDDSQKLFQSVIYDNEEPLIAMMSFYNK